MEGRRPRRPIWSDGENPPKGEFIQKSNCPNFQQKPSRFRDGFLFWTIDYPPSNIPIHRVDVSTKRRECYRSLPHIRRGYREHQMLNTVP